MHSHLHPQAYKDESDAAAHHGTQKDGATTAEQLLHLLPDRREVLFVSNEEQIPAQRLIAVDATVQKHVVRRFRGRTIVTAWLQPVDGRTTDGAMVWRCMAAQPLFPDVRRWIGMTDIRKLVMPKMAPPNDQPLTAQLFYGLKHSWLPEVMQNCHNSERPH